MSHSIEEAFCFTSVAAMQADQLPHHFATFPEAENAAKGAYGKDFPDGIFAFPMGMLIQLCCSASALRLAISTF